MPHKIPQFKITPKLWEPQASNSVHKFSEVYRFFSKKKSSKLDQASGIYYQKACEGKISEKGQLLAVLNESDSSQCKLLHEWLLAVREVYEGDSLHLAIT